MNYNVQKKMKTTSYIKFSKSDDFPIEVIESIKHDVQKNYFYEDYIYVSPTSNTIVIFYNQLILQFISYIKPYPYNYSYSLLSRLKFKFKLDGDESLYESLINININELKWFQCIKRNLEQSKLIEEDSDKQNLLIKLNILIEEYILKGL
jgi:hypothetical protein